MLLPPRCCTSRHGVQAKFFVGGNWKCNGTHASVEQLVMGLNAGRVPSDIDVVVAPPFIFLDWVRANINGQYDVAAQNCWVKSDGAFTGEISAEMLKDAQVPWVITGHSERRSLCGESNTFVGQKTGHALEVGLKVGEGPLGTGSSRHAAAAPSTTPASSCWASLDPPPTRLQLSYACTRHAAKQPQPVIAAHWCALADAVFARHCMAQLLPSSIWHVGSKQPFPHILTCMHCCALFLPCCAGHCMHRRGKHQNGPSWLLGI